MTSFTKESKLFPLGLAVLLWAANVLFHLEFSFWITTEYETPLGAIVLRDYFYFFAACLVLPLVGFLYLRYQQAVDSGPTLLGWVLWTVATFASWQWLLTTKIEAIHFIQYGIIVWLFARALDPNKEKWPLLSLVLLVTLLGVIDEANQYFYLAAGYGFYLDFNDFVLNELGCLAGLLCYYGFSSPMDNANKPAYRSPTMSSSSTILASVYVSLVLGVLVLIGAGLLGFNPTAEIEPGGLSDSSGSLILYLQRAPDLFGSWQASFYDYPYRVLHPVSGILLMLCGFLAVGFSEYLALSSGHKLLSILIRR